jgi:hypothetical protein
MGRSLDAYVGYALLPYTEYAESNVFDLIASEAGFEGLDGEDKWIYRCFRETLGLPDLEPELKKIEHLPYDEWKQQPIYKVWSEQRDQVNEARKDLRVEVSYFGVGDYTQPILYYKDLSAEGYYTPFDVPTFTEEEVSVAREALMTFAGIVHLDKYYEGLGRDLSKDLGMKAWANYY